MRSSSAMMKSHVSKPRVIHALEQLMGLPLSEDGKFQSWEPMAIKRNILLSQRELEDISGND